MAMNSSIYNGTYYFNIITYDTDGKSILDTYKQFLIMKSNNLGA